MVAETERGRGRERQREMILTRTRTLGILFVTNYSWISDLQIRHQFCSKQEHFHYNLQIFCKLTMFWENF